MTCSRAYLTASTYVFLALLLLPLRAGAQTAAPKDLQHLLHAFADMPGLEASFVEEKRIALLAQPLESRGRLYFAKPGLLLRRVEAPSPSEVVVTPEQLRVRNQGEAQTIDLRARPDLKPFVESLVWILAGNQKALGEVYRLEYTSDPKQGTWQLTLTPMREPLSQLVQQIRIRGEGLAVSEVLVRETSGDETMTRILTANPRRTFDDSERRRLFGDAGARGGSP